MSQEQFSFVDEEHKVLDFWKKENIFEKTLEKTKGGKPYNFYDGPPFATGLPHHGHLVAGTLKDIIPRYFTMKGRYVTRRFGWDCHGLPVEHEIDKKLGMSAQEAVEKLGVAGYNQECRGIVQRYTQEWEKTVTRVGRWVDFEDNYKTMDTNFMESVWWVFKSLWDQDLIYQGTKVVPYSTALQTVLSNFEASSNYKDVQDPAVSVLFKIKELENTYALAWTTTPWTLPSNLALCVNADVTYVKAWDEKLQAHIILAEERFEAYKKRHELEVKSSMLGSELTGMHYEPLFNYFSELESEGAFQILSDSYVTTTDGTGIVHQAPAFGEDDDRVLKAHNIKVSVCPIDDAGQFTEEVSDFKGQHVKEADKGIAKMLKEEGKLYQQDTLVHSYPFCPRSDTPLIYRTIPSWYVDISKVKDKMISANEKISWVPDHIQHGRFGKWLEGARDWAISRNRVWGTPLPIWINEETGNKVCIGSIEDLKKYTGVTVDDLHREFVDELEFSIDGEDGVYKRIPEVLDCWFESGSMPYAQLHYPFENKDKFDDLFPAEYIAEGLDQTRGWFYTLTVIAAALYDKPAFKNVIVNGMVMAEDGKKMSKRLRNYTAPDELMEKFGADALRLFLINSGLVRAEELRFSDDGVKDMVRRALLPWYNAFKFFETYAEVDKWSYHEHAKIGDNILDKWLLSKLESLIKQVNHEMEHYRLYNVVPQLFEFIDHLTNWYIRLNRRRFWEGELTEDKAAAYSALYKTLLTVSELMAPFSPFLSETIYQRLKKFDDNTAEQSVHLRSYPETSGDIIDQTLEDAVQRMQEIILLGRQKRNQEKIKVKTPLSSLTIIHAEKDVLDQIQKLENYIKIELNVKNINYSDQEDEFISLYAKPNSPVLGKRLGKAFGQYRMKIQDLPSETLKSVEKGESISIDSETFSSTEILVFREAKEGVNAVSNRFITINLDCNLNDDLISEGLAREVVNRIQKTRKELNFNVDDRINVNYNGSTRIKDALLEHSQYVASETLSHQIVFQEDLVSVHKFDIDGENLTIELEVAN